MSTISVIFAEFVISNQRETCVGTSLLVISNHPDSDLSTNDYGVNIQLKFHINEGTRRQ